MLCMFHPMGASVRLRIPYSIFALLLCSAFCLFSAPLAHAKGNSHIGTFSSGYGGVHLTRWQKSAAPTDADCRAVIQVPCYSPQEMRNAYDLTPVINAGYVGKGETIVIIDSFGSPTALADLKQFDADYGLPDPPSFKVLSPLGTVPFDPTNNDQAGWAEETSLDVQWSHAMAPGANIVLLTSPVSETQGVQGMPEFLKLEEYALDNHLGQIISQSWGTTENTLFTIPAGRQVLRDFENFYKRAAFSGITVLASAGDSGTANPDVNGNTYPYPTVGYPASSPWVTAVGGTSLYADTNGNYQSETVWNDGSQDATGGGVSQYFGEPFYQALLPASDQKLLKGHRGLPDISYNADPNTSIPVYLGFLPGAVGYYLFGGTSEGSPQWAGLIADANQFAHRSLGFLNPKLYLLGLNKHEPASVFHDITSGNNAQPPIPGYNATPGWDATTGWGSPIAQPLFKALAWLW
jgi:subtilase family serine protease